ncbi:MAG: hypothetical protein AABY07_00675 [Nanoarchaeota archaeon]
MFFAFWGTASITYYLSHQDNTIGTILNDIWGTLFISGIIFGIIFLVYFLIYYFGEGAKLKRAQDKYIAEKVRISAQEDNKLREKVIIWEKEAKKEYEAREK